MSEKEKYTESERRAIRICAGNAGETFRNEAITAHRSLLSRIRSRRTKLPYGDPYFEFMREVDTPMPDLGLRAIRRREVLADAALSK